MLTVQHKIPTRNEFIFAFALDPGVNVLFARAFVPHAYACVCINTRAFYLCLCDLILYAWLLYSIS